MRKLTFYFILFLVVLLAAISWSEGQSGYEPDQYLPVVYQSSNMPTPAPTMSPIETPYPPPSQGRSLSCELVCNDTSCWTWCGGGN